MGTLTKANRKLSEKIAGKDAFLSDFTNDDLDINDEHDDEIAENNRQIRELERQVDGATDKDEIQGLRRRLGESDDEDERESIRARLEGTLTDAAERKAVRAEIRALAKENRRIQAHQLGVFVETADGESFPDDALAGMPVRVRTKLLQDVNRHLEGEDSPSRAERRGG